MTTTIDTAFNDEPGPIRILACADLHVSATANLAGMQPVDASTRRPLVLSQARRTLAWIGETARAERTELILVAGDVYPDPRPLPAAETVVQEAFSSWADDGRLVLVLLGNHDRPNGAGTHALEPLKHLRPGQIVVVDTFAPLAVLRTPNGLRVATFTDPAQIERTCRDGGEQIAAWVFPIPYPARAVAAEQSESAAATSGVMAQGINTFMAVHAQLAPLCADVAPDAPCILFGHGTLEGAAYNDYQTVPLADSPISTDTFPTYDLAVWGHLHKRQAVASPWVRDSAAGAALAFTHGYVGSPDRQDFGEEGQSKGVSIFASDLDLDGGGVCAAWRGHFLPNPGSRSFVTLDPDELRQHADEIRGEVERGDQSWVYRVVAGTRDGVTEAENDEIGALVRDLKSAGVTIANACKVQRADRARVEDVQTELGFEGVLNAVFLARPDLAPDAETIRGDVRTWAAEQGSAGKVGAA